MKIRKSWAKKFYNIGPGTTNTRLGQKCKAKFTNALADITEVNMTADKKLYKIGLLGLYYTAFLVVSY